MSLKILSIGSDRNLFKKDSDAQKRIRDYGKLFDELHIIVFADKKLGFSDLKLDGNIFIYPTDHRHKILYLWNIYKIVKRIILNSSFMIHDSIITSQDPFESGLAGWLLKLWLNIPLQIQVHTDIFSPYFAKESLLNRLRVLLAKFLLPRADGIRVVSERIKNSLSTFLPAGRHGDFQLSTKIVVLPVFVDVKKIQSAKVKTDLHRKYPDHGFIILMASRLTREKNINMAIEAMKEILTPKPSALNPLLLVVGDGPEREALELKVSAEGGSAFGGKSYKLENNIVFESWTNDLISYYKTADLFLLTSNYEGYGRTIVEAMSAGLPIVMTDVGLAGSIAVNDLDGIVVGVGDARALSSAILDLAGNSGKIEEFRINSRKLTEKFVTKQEYLEQYKNSLMMLK